MPRKAVSRDRLIELIQARVQSKLHHFGHIPAPFPIRIQSRDGGTNWKIEQVIGVPSSFFNDYMTIVRDLMDEYELTPGPSGEWALGQ
jgi:hypothetical protein